MGVEFQVEATMVPMGINFDGESHRCGGGCKCHGRK